MISVQRPTSTSRFKVQTKFKFCRRFEVKVKVRSRGGQAQVQRQRRTPDSANVHGQVQAQVLALVRVLLLTQVQTHARVAPEKRREYQYGVGGTPGIPPRPGERGATAILPQRKRKGSQFGSKVSLPRQTRRRYDPPNMQGTKVEENPSAPERWVEVGVREK